MTIRILHIIDSLDRGGTEKQLGLLALGLPREEFDLHVCALTRGGPWQEELNQAGIPVTVLGRRLPLDPLAWWRLREHVARLKPDVIHSWRPGASGWAWSVARSCGVRRWIVGLQNVDSGRTRAQRAMDRLVARRCHVMAVNSAAVRDFYVEHGLPAEKLRIIPNGVSPAPAPTATRQQLLDEFGLPDGSRLIGFVGPLRPEKRGKDAIWAADLLKVIRDDVHLLVFGDGPHRQRLERFRDQVEIADKVHVLGDRGDVPRWLPHFDLLWSTSSSEGQSNAILEAMVAGVPVVASDIPGTRELIEHGVTGYLVPVGQRAGFAKWAEHLLDNPDTARSLGEDGRQRVLRDFPVDKVIEGYATLYREG
jgi:glycosyltransferase involved in cell wall biosynthesis